MGEIKIHHFAHSKDACDEAVAYTSGLYRLIRQILSDNVSFYIPALIITYNIPNDELLDENNIDFHIRFVNENYNGANRMLISAGRYITFESVELCVDNKNQIQALELVYKNSKMAIKVMPPDTICKKAVITPHKDMATLVLNFTDDENVIQTSNSRMFREFLLSEHLSKQWISNPKVKKAYPDIFALNQKAYQEYIEREKLLEERRKIASIQFEESRKLAVRQQILRRETAENIINKNVDSKLVLGIDDQKESFRLGYEQVKDKFVQQIEPIRDSFNNRWVKCEECGKIKRDTEFWSYGGLNRVNLGHCNLCDSKRGKRRA